MPVQRFRSGAMRRPGAAPGLKRVPQLSGRKPLAGHTVEFLRSPVDLLSRAQRELGEIAAFHVFQRNMVAVFGPEAHEAVFRAPDELLSPSEAYKIMTPVFGKDVVYDAPPARMAEQLKMLTLALKEHRMRTYGEAVVFETEREIRPWGEAGVVDFVDFCRVLTNFTSSRCLLGREFREGMSKEFASVYRDLEGGVTPIAYINAHLPIPAFRKRDRARIRMVEMIKSIVDARRGEKREGEDFLQTLMESHYADGHALSEHEITGMLLAAMFAGHHTSSVTTAWTLIELLRNPQYLHQVTDEIDRVLGKQAVSYHALRELTFTENCVKEALRIHPPFIMLVRVARKDFVFKEWLVPAGTWIVISPMVSHQIPEVFRNPGAFEPERFAPPREEDKRDFAYIAFGGGRHKCLGNAFALLQIKAILSMLLGQFEFELAGDPIEPDFGGLVVTPKEPCRVLYRKRERPSVTMSMATELEQATNEVTFMPAQAVERREHKVQTADKYRNETANAKEGMRRLSVILDRDLCQGHAVCVGEAPEIFRLGPDGKVEAIDDEPALKFHDDVRAAARFCPTHAIRLRDE